mgnify:FL=1
MHKHDANTHSLTHKHDHNTSGLNESIGIASNRASKPRIDNKMERPQTAHAQSKQIKVFRLVNYYFPFSQQLNSLKMLLLLKL